MTLRSALSDPARRRKWLLYAAGAVGLYALVGFLIAPPIVRSQAEEALKTELGRDVRIRELAINPFALSLTVRGFELYDADESRFIEVAELYVNLQLSSIFNRAVTLSEARLVSPFVHVKILKDGSLNFADVLERLAADEADEAKASEPSPPPAILIALANVVEGRVVFTDSSRRTRFEHEISPLDVKLRDFSTQPDDQSPYSFSATTGAGETLSWEGNFTVVPLASSGEFALTGIRPRTGWLYFQDDLSFEVVDGTVDVRGEYALGANEGLTVRLRDGRIEVRDLAIEERATGQRAVAVPVFDVEGLSVEYPEQRARIARIHTADGRYHMQRNADGRLRIERLLESQEAVDEADRVVPATTASTPTGAESTPPWHLEIDEIEVAGYHVEFEDRSTPELVTLVFDPIGLQVQGLTNEPGRPAEIALDVGFQESGRIAAKGRVGADPLLAELDLTLADVDLGSFEPYWSEQLAVAMLAGTFDLTGRATASSPDGADAELAFDGGLGIKGLRTSDRGQGESLVSWSALELEGLAVRSQPASVALRRLTMREPSLHLQLDADGGSNLQRIVPAAVEPPPEAEARASAETTSSEPVPVRIDLVQIEAASMRIVDRSVTPSFTSGISELSGRIEGLSSETTARSKVDFGGLLNGATPMQISGVVSPLSQNAYADLKIHFVNFELTPFTPYSGRYIGKAIERGKLFLDLDYELDGKVLAGENKIFLDQFTLGENIESPDAVDLPVGLAIGLLKDRKGEIHIDLPVRGDVDDPEFSVAGLIAGALRNLITKVALSPFSLIGGLVGVDGDEMRFIEFEPGSDQLPLTERAKLDALATALVERPGLSLELAGGAAPSIDRPALQTAAFDAQIRRARYEELQEKWFGDRPKRVEDVVVAPEDESRLLREAFVKRFGASPEIVIALPAADQGVSAESPLSDLGRLQRAARVRMEAEVEVDDGTLRQLARQRAQTIRDALVADGRIPVERVFLLDPDLEEVPDATRARSAMSLAVH